MRGIPLSLRIPLGLTWAVVITGIVILISNIARGKVINTTALIIWIVVALILSSISVWFWLRNRKNRPSP